MNKKTNIFCWQGINKAGAIVAGEITTTHAKLAKELLGQQGIAVRLLKKKRFSFFSPHTKKITALDIMLFSRQLATLYKAGIPLAQALDVLSKTVEKIALKNLILALKNEVSAGHPLHQALALYPRYFDGLYCNLIAMGEQSGTLDILLQQIAAYQENLHLLKKKIKKALFYPAIVFVVAIVVSSILLLFVVPQFEILFQSFGGKLPGFTLFVIQVSQNFKHYGWLWVLLSFAAVVIFKQAKKRSLGFSDHINRGILKLPIIGKILQNAAIARFGKTLALTFAAGLPLVDALNSVAGTVGNPCFAKAILHIRQEVSQGQRIVVAMQQTGRFPSLVEHMVGIGEEAGALEIMLGKIADFFEAEVSMAVDTLSSLLEPFIMVILGLLVGGLVVAMYLPIFKLGTIL
jgi:type IV pilus assembly protein PilC